MAELPKLPGFNFTDPTVTKFNRSHTFTVKNGFKLPKHNFAGIGTKQLESQSVKYIDPIRSFSFDPILTYGRSKVRDFPQFRPHYEVYDKKCLMFKAYFKQTITESQWEDYRIRYVNIIYFLEDDTLTVIEPKTLNSGFVQGRLVGRSRILKNTTQYWHWKDLAIGKDVCINGIIYHLVDCDDFTREFMASQGLIMSTSEDLPSDPYTENRKHQSQSIKTQSHGESYKFYNNHDGILKFKALWDDRDSEFGDIRKYEIYYFLVDNTVAMREILEKNSGRDPCPRIFKRLKLPKNQLNYPTVVSSNIFETSETVEYYEPKDFLVGETIFILGKKLFLYDCDQFTRDFYKKYLDIDQKPSVELEKPSKPPPKQQIQQSHKPNFVQRILNANKKLVYEMIMDAVHPEDTIRRFLLIYALDNGTCKIIEPPIKNSGIQGGRYLSDTLLIKPGSNQYYTPVDFYIGGIIEVFGVRFKIIGADLGVYQYMKENSEKFPQEIIDNIRNYMIDKGYIDKEKMVEK